jgi:aromatic ring-opening dioxygenase catalytic subunit (LigB family)
MIFFEDKQKIPVLFLGHGSPMNTIGENEFVTGVRDIAITKTKTQSGSLPVGTLGNQ